MNDLPVQDDGDQVRQACGGCCLGVVCEHCWLGGRRRLISQTFSSKLRLQLLRPLAPPSAILPLVHLPA